VSNQPMTAEKLLEIIGKATPGEWAKAELAIWAGDPLNGGTKVALPLYVGNLEEERANGDAIAAAHNEAPRIIRELLARVAELKAQVTPRPIEEAPKGERVLVFCPEESDYGYTAAWVVGEYVLHSWEGDSRLDDGVQPTYWLPLPLDPTEEKQP